MEGPGPAIAAGSRQSAVHLDLAGTDRLRRSIDTTEPVDRRLSRWIRDLDKFLTRRAKYLIYD